jgi:hypothetical protein
MRHQLSKIRNERAKKDPKSNEPLLTRFPERAQLVAAQGAPGLDKLQDGQRLSGGLPQSPKVCKFGLMLKILPSIQKMVESSLVYCSLLKNSNAK